LGIITEFNPSPLNQWRVPYTMTFEPQQDISNGVNGSYALNSPEVSLGNALTSLNGLLGGTPFAIPTSLISSVTSLVGSVNSALLAAGGLIANITASPLAQILLNCEATQSAAGELVGNSDSRISSPAIDVLAYSTTVGTLVTSPATPNFQLRVINPNLFLLAAQYLGSAQNWVQIAALNGLIDPQPIGEFVLAIP
jgi:hypothetical protein